MKTEIVFILDRSGSMAGLEKDTIGGFNALLEKNKKMDGDVTITTVLFDDQYELLHDRMNIHSIAPLTDEHYTVRGTTALYDAIGKSIEKMSHIQQMAVKEHKADNVIFIITTDGEENSSNQYNAASIKKLISKHKELGWEFTFLGANIDAIQAAQTIGIQKDEAVDFIADSKGTEVVFEALADQIVHYRKTGARNKNWKQSIELDTSSRKKR